MSKTHKGLYEVGQKITKHYPGKYWEDILKSTELLSVIEKHKLNALEVEYIRMGFQSVVVHTECPDPDSKFPFGRPKNAGKTYRDIKPEYYAWFLKQEWKEKWPQVIAYCAQYKNGLKRLSIEMAEDDKEAEKLIKDINKLE